MIEISPPREPRALPPGETEADYVYTSAANEVDWRNYWNVIVKRRRLLVLVFLLVLGIGSYFSVTATPLYTATSVLRIEPQNPAVTGVPEIWKLTEGSVDYYGTQFALLKSRRLADKVITELQLDSNDAFTKIYIVHSSIVSRATSATLGNLQYVVSLIASWITPSPNITRQPLPSEKTFGAQSDAGEFVFAAKTSPWAGRYLSLLTVNPVKGTRLVEIQFTTPDPNLSQRLANAHAKAFIAMNVETSQELTQEARKFLDAKNDELRKVLEGSEEKLNRFRQAHGIVSMEKGENVVVDRLVAVNQKLTEARAKRIEAESLKKTVENKPVQYLSEVATQGLVPSLRATLQNLEAERVRLSSTFKPDHPRMLELNKQINEAQRSLKAEIGNMVKGIQENYSSARSKELALEAEAQKQQGLALTMKELGVEFAVLEEEVKVNRGLYESVLNRLHSTNVVNDLAISNMQVLQQAERPSFPSSPIPVNDLGLSAFLGIFFGVGLIFALEYLDSAVSTPQHVWGAVALSTFGVVPDLNSIKPLLYSRAPGVGLLNRLTSLRLPSRSNPPGELIVEHHPLSILTESYRTIRTALLFSQAERPPQVILLTSPSPGEGKTVTSLNLSVALAQDGHKVITIDADLRKGRCHARLGLTNHRGLSNVLTGNIALKDGIQETSVSGLSLLARGIRPPNPGELLGSNKMKEVLASLRESYDFIIMDSPPAIAISDASVLSVNSDAVILVFHGKKTTRASARQAMERLEAVRAPILGAILNGVNLRNPDYAYYRFYYGSDYGMFRENIHRSNNGNIKDTVAEPELPEIEVSSSESGPGTVTREFFNHLMAKFSETVGPMAPIIVTDGVAYLGESLDDFPKSRLKELLEKMCEEIPDEKRRQSFQNSMVSEIRAL